MTIALREPNAKIDKLYLTLNDDAPSELGEPAINCSGQDIASTNVWLEAECADEIGLFWDSEQDPGASLNRFLQAPSRNNDAGENAFDSYKVKFRFKVSEAGQYRIFTRHLSYNGFDDSFWVQINDGPLNLAYLGANRNSFTWAQLGASAKYALRTGNNTITIVVREANARLDKLFITPGR